jgi:uncharacterized membrane protein
MKSHQAFSTAVLLVIAIWIGGNGSAAAMEPREWTFTTIDFPGGASTAVLDINAEGDIVGSYNDAGGAHGFVLSRLGDFTTIDFPGAVFTRAAAINSRGDIVGQYRLPSDPMQARHGFLLRDGEFTTIDPPGARFTNALGINSRGDIVGRFCTTLPCALDGTNVRGFLMSEGEFTTIHFPEARGTNAWKIDAQGDIVGSYTSADGKKHLFVSRDGDFIAIDVPGAADIAAENGGINSRGDIAGIYCDSSPCRGTNPDAHGFLLSKHGDLTTIDFPGAIDTNALAISARGDIVGVYDDATGTHGFLLTRQ